MEKKILFLLVGIFWLVIIFGFIGFKEFTLRSGQEVLLKTRPVDPRDLFRGDYVVLNYEISSLDLSNVYSDYKEFKINDNVYAALKIENGYGSVAGVYRNAPYGLYIKGKIIYSSGSRLIVEYGIESYFVPEGKGRDVEQYRGKNLDVKVSVDKFGNAVIKSLVVEGKELSFK